MGRRRKSSNVGVKFISLLLFVNDVLVTCNARTSDSPVPFIRNFNYSTSPTSSAGDVVTPHSPPSEELPLPNDPSELPTNTEKTSHDPRSNEKREPALPISDENHTNSAERSNSAHSGFIRPRYQRSISESGIHQSSDTNKEHSNNNPTTLSSNGPGQQFLKRRKKNIAALARKGWLKNIRSFRPERSLSYITFPAAYTNPYDRAKILSLTDGSIEDETNDDLQCVDVSDSEDSNEVDNSLTRSNIYKRNLGALARTGRLPPLHWRRSWWAYKRQTEEEPSGRPRWFPLTSDAAYRYPVYKQKAKRCKKSLRNMEDGLWTDEGTSESKRNIGMLARKGMIPYRDLRILGKTSTRNKYFPWMKGKNPHTDKRNVQSMARKGMLPSTERRGFSSEENEIGLPLSVVRRNIAMLAGKNMLPIRSMREDNENENYGIDMKRNIAFLASKGMLPQKRSEEFDPYQDIEATKEFIDYGNKRNIAFLASKGALPIRHLRNYDAFGNDLYAVDKRNVAHLAMRGIKPIVNLANKRNIRLLASKGMLPYRSSSSEILDSDGENIQSPEEFVPIPLLDEPEEGTLLEPIADLSNPDRKRNIAWLARQGMIPPRKTRESDYLQGFADIDDQYMSNADGSDLVSPTEIGRSTEDGETKLEVQDFDKRNVARLAAKGLLPPRYKRDVLPEEQNSGLSDDDNKEKEREIELDSYPLTSTASAYERQIRKRSTEFNQTPADEMHVDEKRNIRFLASKGMIPSRNSRELENQEQMETKRNIAFLASKGMIPSPRSRNTNYGNFYTGSDKRNIAFLASKGMIPGRRSLDTYADESGNQYGSGKRNIQFLASKGRIPNRESRDSLDDESDKDEEKRNIQFLARKGMIPTRKMHEENGDFLFQDKRNIASLASKGMIPNRGLRDLFSDENGDLEKRNIAFLASKGMIPNRGSRDSATNGEENIDSAMDKRNIASLASKGLIPNYRSRESGKTEDMQKRNIGFLAKNGMIPNRGSRDSAVFSPEHVSESDKRNVAFLARNGMIPGRGSRNVQFNENKFQQGINRNFLDEIGIQESPRRMKNQFSEVDDEQMINLDGIETDVSGSSEWMKRNIAFLASKGMIPKRDQKDAMSSSKQNLNFTDLSNLRLPEKISIESDEIRNKEMPQNLDNKRNIAAMANKGMLPHRNKRHANVMDVESEPTKFGASEVINERTHAKLVKRNVAVLARKGMMPTRMSRKPTNKDNRTKWISKGSILDSTPLQKQGSISNKNNDSEPNNWNNAPRHEVTAKTPEKGLASKIISLKTSPEVKIHRGIEGTIAALRSGARQKRSIENGRRIYNSFRQ